MRNYNYEKVLKIFHEYSGIPIEANECNWVMKENEHFLYAFKLTDAGANYKLLSDSDLASLSETTRNWCIENQKSIFDDILIVFFYEDENADEIYFKTVNGMASKLMKLLD